MSDGLSWIPRLKLKQGGPVETFLQGCKIELDTYCKNVTPGDNRLPARVYAHKDKLSNRCEYALYDASAQLQQAVASLRYMVRECEDDSGKYCADVEVGHWALRDGPRSLAPRQWWST